MKYSLIMTAYIEAYRLFGLLIHSDIHNSAAIEAAKISLIATSKLFKDKPIRKNDGKALYADLSNIKKANVLTKMINSNLELTLKFNDDLKKYLSEDINNQLLNEEGEKILFSNFDKVLVAELEQMAYSYVNLIRLTKLEHGSKGISYLVSANGINMPQWWIHTKMNDFSVSSLKHSLSLIRTSTTKGSQVHSSRYLSNGSGALFPINITAAYLIDAFKKVGSKVEKKNELITNYMAKYDKVVKGGYSFVNTPAKTLLYAESYNYGAKFQELKMHLTIITLSGFGSPLRQADFEFMRYHFWRFNHLALKRKLLK